MSEGPLKRQKRDIVHVSRDMIECIARHCEWPELVALSRVSKRCREIALKFLPDALEELESFLRKHVSVQWGIMKYRWSYGDLRFPLEDWRYRETLKYPWKYPVLQLLAFTYGRDNILPSDEKHAEMMQRYFNNQKT